ncbi:MAG: dTDP-4-dehydrorhamnose 3,5-epimerase [Tenuifilaceae bacterium]|jgi:dTDP-4-dehydrorhamnose 3,5-epimerase|nr:dTDP-4-dehydrorhamnose 3,5-epimerase [Bacteroidales bacterium]MDI9516263.1 dTDP-4-dehydrorhamnose 3,5-epimerase [Bacteroidota bacterium]NLH57608.1 dTDP-4-dehydrorhamnose 3,5-epimerase [Rikenellaceae bacterium]OQC64965.1 MAG: dTDP-4-dehydrorhamnose 3,5-epimerase [Bacteroidetes bacterium ADurb.Bin008]HOF90505.1 dTDP-4-dehydrorhamnose 3,5-epimerase [Tenuifilaceae bacterium]
MVFNKTFIDGVFIIEPKVFGDSRGYFFESYNQKEFEEKVGPITFVQDNESKSSYGVLRGLHFQKPPFAQAKLVRCAEGEVFDVAVDLRQASPTFGKYVAVNLSGENKKQLFIPRGFAHGFVVLSQNAVIIYKVDNLYAPEYDTGIMWNDPQLNINWGIEEEDIILSTKDTSLPLLRDTDVKF